jgi:hypothetical protein
MIKIMDRRSRHQEVCFSPPARLAACILVLAALLGCASVDQTTPSPGYIQKNSAGGTGGEVRPLPDGWLEATGVASISNITPEEARRQAIMSACTSALQYQGVQVSQRNLDVQAESNHKIIHDDFMSLTSLATRGVILEKVIVEEKVLAAGNDLQKFVRVKVKIGRQEGEKDPYFTVKASLNREVFKENDNLQVTFTSSQDCYLTILDITDKDVYVLYPNSYTSDNFIAKGEQFSLPDETQRKAGMTLPALLPPGKSTDMGAVKVLATKRKASLEALAKQSEYGTGCLALQDLLGFMVKIPLSEVEEVDLPYMITK